MHFRFRKAIPNHNPPPPPPWITPLFQDREFTGKVCEIVNGDALMIKAGGKFRKIFLASIRYTDTLTFIR